MRASALRLFALSIYEVLQVPSVFRTVDFYTALAKDEDEICALMQVLLESPDETRAARSLRGEQAKSLMDTLTQARVHLN